MYECARFPSECLIVSLVYIERLVATSEVPILCTSWRPILLAGLILAQKVWDDRSLHNVDFSFFCPMFTLQVWASDGPLGTLSPARTLRVAALP